jgi:hypothetical protein
VNKARIPMRWRRARPYRRPLRSRPKDRLRCRSAAAGPRPAARRAARQCGRDKATQRRRITGESELDRLAGKRLSFAIEQQLGRSRGRLTEPRGRAAGFSDWPFWNAHPRPLLAVFAVFCSKYQSSLHLAQSRGTGHSSAAGRVSITSDYGNYGHRCYLSKIEYRADDRLVTARGPSPRRIISHSCE